MSEIAAIQVTPDSFVGDAPWRRPAPGTPALPEPLIGGVTVAPLLGMSDRRGTLYELLTARDGEIEPIVHVYRVHAAAGSVRAWVYHKWQHDRLSFTEGAFRVVLYDIRQDSPTCGLLNVMDVGVDNPCRLRIPPFVVHAVHNRGDDASFVNMPTRAYDPARPDKFRLPPDHPGVPYRFE